MNAWGRVIGVAACTVLVLAVAAPGPSATRVTSAPGRSAQPGSPFYGDLLPLWGNGQFFPLLYSRDAVEG